MNESHAEAVRELRFRLAGTTNDDGRPFEDVEPLFAAIEAAHEGERSALAELEHVFFALPVAACVIREDGLVVRANREARALLGAAPGARHPLASLRDGEGHPLAAEANPLSVLPAGPSRQAFVRFHGPTDVPRLLWIATSPLRGGCFSLIAVDRTAHERDREEKGRFLDVLGHDLRNPLMAVHLQASYLERFLERTQAPTTMRRSANRIATTARRLGHLVSQLLELARDHAGTMVLARARTDLGAVAREAAEELALLAPENAIAVRVQGDAVGLWDPVCLHQVVGNLLANAIAHSAAGSGVEVTVTGRDAQVVVLVRDHGSGIPPEDVDAIFGAFVRGKSTGGSRLPRVSSSLGLGLFIVELIVRAHGGRIEVASRLGEGSTFTLTLPRWPTPL